MCRTVHETSENTTETPWNPTRPIQRRPRGGARSVVKTTALSRFLSTPQLPDLASGSAPAVSAPAACSWPAAVVVVVAEHGLSSISHRGVALRLRGLKRASSTGTVLCCEALQHSGLPPGTEFMPVVLSLRGTAVFCFERLISRNGVLRRDWGRV